MALPKVYDTDTPLIFPEYSVFERGLVTFEEESVMHQLTLSLRVATSETLPIYTLIQEKLGTAYDDVNTTPVAMPASGDPRVRIYDKIIVQGTQTVLSDLLRRLEAKVGSPAMVDSLGESTGMALGKID